MVNRCFIMGRLTCDPFIRNISDETKLAEFTVAVNYTANATRVPHFIPVVCFGGWAKNLEAKRGDMVFVSGHLRYEAWETDGQKRCRLKVVADSLKEIRKTLPKPENPEWPVLIPDSEVRCSTQAPEL